ncbi:MAG: tol-pal system-associated acyl-CoA thioesterase [Methylococcaceae bacterium]|nr:tol-pal system-associated acyl-CoA thioesterase [Methylococcaceae bacterium]
MKTQFLWPVRVYYEDTDAGGVVYHANYLKFFERARTERLRNLGFEQNELRGSHGVLFVVRSVRLEYLKSARFNDELLVTAEVRELRRASMVFEQEIRRDGRDGEKICEASVRIACLNDDDLRPAAMPDFLLQRIKDVL